MPRPLAKMLICSSTSKAIEIACRSFRALSEEPPTTGSSQLNAIYPILLSTDVGRGGALPLLLGCHVGIAFDGHPHRLVELVRADARSVVVPLQEFVPVGDPF